MSRSERVSVLYWRRTQGLNKDDKQVTSYERLNGSHGNNLKATKSHNNRVTLCHNGYETDTRL